MAHILLRYIMWPWYFVMLFIGQSICPSVSKYGFVNISGISDYSLSLNSEGKGQGTCEEGFH